MKLTCPILCYSQICVLSILLLLTVAVCETLNAHLSLNVEGNGFHRNLIYEIHIDNSLEECYTAIHLELPSALYVNTNELTDLIRLGISTACAVGESNVELFAEEVYSQNVTVCSPLINKGSTLKFPIHQRYQYAKENSTHTTVTIPKPILLLGCKQRMKEYRTSKINLCSLCAEIIPKWREIPYVVDTEDVVWIIPIGNTAILTVVIYITLLLTILCTVLLSQTIRNFASKEREKIE